MSMGEGGEWNHHSNDKESQSEQRTVVVVVSTLTDIIDPNRCVLGRDNKWQREKKRERERQRGWRCTRWNISTSSSSSSSRPALQSSIFSLLTNCLSVNRDRLADRKIGLGEVFGFGSAARPQASDVQHDRRRDENPSAVVRSVVPQKSLFLQKFNSPACYISHMYMFIYKERVYGIPPKLEIYSGGKYTTVLLCFQQSCASAFVRFRFICIIYNIMYLYTHNFYYYPFSHLP